MKVQSKTYGITGRFAPEYSVLLAQLPCQSKQFNILPKDRSAERIYVCKLSVSLWTIWLGASGLMQS